MFVHSSAVLLKPPADTIKSLTAEAKAQTGFRFRRVNRFILLSICGSHFCVQGRQLPPDTAVWLTTENGTVADTEKGLNQLFVQRIFPKPYNFINTMSNTASFYIAQSLKLQSPNITMACKDFAFERGLSLARADLRRGAVSAALVGGVDEAVFSERNLQSRFADNLKDGSAWLYLNQEREGAMGEIGAIRTMAGQEQAMAWLAAQNLAAKPVVTFGVRIEADEQQQWLASLAQPQHFDFLSDYGYFDSAPAAAICLFMEQFKGCQGLHINKDLDGRYTMVSSQVF